MHDAQLRHGAQLRRGVSKPAERPMSPENAVSPGNGGDLNTLGQALEFGKDARRHSMPAEVCLGSRRPPRRTEPRGASAVAIIAVLVVLAAVIGVWFWISSQASQRELAAKQELGKLGVLVVMDATGTHVASVNLSTMPAGGALDEAVELLTHFPALNSLDASRTAFNDEHAAVLSGIRSLNTVTLIESEVTDGCLVHLAKLSQLEALNLALTKVSDVGLEALPGSGKLKVLDLSGTGVSANLSPLAKLPTLTWLALRNCTLEDSALDSLATSPSLQRLSLESATVSAEAIQKLRGKLPDLRVGTGSLAAGADAPKTEDPAGIEDTNESAPEGEQSQPSPDE